MPRTFVICKPDAVERGLVGEIIARFERKGLRLGRGRPARGRVTDVPDAHAAAQAQHVLGAEDLAHQTVVLALVQMLALAGGDAQIGRAHV